MTSMANITVKKADGTTDVVYTGLAGSSGDQTPAIWQNATVGTTPAEAPKLELVAAPNGTGRARRMRFKFTWPIASQDAGGNKLISGQHILEGSFLTVSSDLTTNITEAVYQGLNLLASSLVKSSTAEGYAPR